LGDSLGDGGYCGIAVKPGVGGSVAAPGEEGKAGLSEVWFESCVTGRIVAPLKNCELDEDLGECGVRGLRPSELWAAGDSGEFFAPACRVDGLRSKFGMIECLEGILAIACVEVLVGGRQFEMIADIQCE
jgi:hypothetical protein